MADTHEPVSKSLTRRDFFKLAAATLGGGAILATPGLAAYLQRGRSTADAQTQGQESPGDFKVITVRDLVQLAGTNSNIADHVRKLDKSVYGKDTIQDDDWVVIASKPKAGESVVVNLLGIAQAGMGKSKPKAGEIGMHIQFQRKGDTSINAIVNDSKHPAADLVHRINGTTDYFFPFSPAFEQNDVNFQGWADVNFPDGVSRPVMSPLGETDSEMLLYIPVTGLKASGYSPDIARISAYRSGLSFPASDTIK